MAPEDDLTFDWTWERPDHAFGSGRVHVVATTSGPEYTIDFFVNGSWRSAFTVGLNESSWDRGALVEPGDVVELRVDGKTVEQKTAPEKVGEYIPPEEPEDVGDVNLSIENATLTPTNPGPLETFTATATIHNSGEETMVTVVFGIEPDGNGPQRMGIVGPASSRTFEVTTQRGADYLGDELVVGVESSEDSTQASWPFGSSDLEPEPEPSPEPEPEPVNDDISIESAGVVDGRVEFTVRNSGSGSAATVGVVMDVNENREQVSSLNLTLQPGTAKTKSFSPEVHFDRIKDSWESITIEARGPTTSDVVTIGLGGPEPSPSPSPSPTPDPTPEPDDEGISPAVLLLPLLL